MLDQSETEIQSRLQLALNGSPSDPYLEYPALLFQSQEKPKPAAVLIPLMREQNSWRILLTRRKDDLPEHSGQVAFPGGRSEPGDSSLEETALRESYEEIGLRPQDVRILGRLRDYLTITNYLVTPIVGSIPWPYPLQLEPREVSRAFSIPLDWLSDPSNHEQRQRLLPPPNPPVSVIYFKPYDGEVLWGASARLTLALIQALTVT